jgi:hypothetical protein
MTNKKVFIAGVLGVLGMLGIMSAGCGGVSLAGLEPEPDAGTTDSGAAGGGPDVLAQVDGGTAGTTGAAGTAGATGRPLGAGCTTDAQCGSTICAKVNPADASGTCCDGHPDACNQCVGGYKTPRSDGTGCGPEMCDGTDRKWHLCRAGACAAEVVQCATALCDKAGNKICPGGAQPAGCALEDNPCFCYDAAGGGHTSYPCP